MPNSRFYAVANGRNPGIFHNHFDYNAQIWGFPRNINKSFATLEAATKFIQDNEYFVQQAKACFKAQRVKPIYFAVAKEGLRPGIYSNYDECMKQLSMSVKWFFNRQSAQEYMNNAFKEQKLMKEANVQTIEIKADIKSEETQGETLFCELIYLAIFWVET